MPVHFDADKECHVIKFEMRVGGKRIRKTKRLPQGVSYETAIQIEQRMLNADDPYHRLRIRLQALNAKPQDPGWVYACISGNGPVKIGMTRTSADTRIRAFNTSSVKPWRVIQIAHVRNVADSEREIHRFLAGQRISTGRELFAIEEGYADGLLNAASKENGWVDPYFASWGASA